MKIDKEKAFKILGGVVIPVIGAGFGLLTNWMDDKKLEKTVAEKVAEALADKVSDK